MERTIQSALITVQLKEENLQLLKKTLGNCDITVCKPDDTRAIAAALERAEVAILNDDLNDQILTGQHLRWIHCCHGGLNKSARPEVFRRGILLSGSAGRSAPALAEHAVMFMLSLTYQLPQLLQAQKEHVWGVEGYGRRPAMQGQTVGIIGCGNTGSEVARRLRAFNMRILAYRRSARAFPEADELYSPALGKPLEEMLPQCDYLVLCCSLNDGSYHLLDKKRLGLLKPTAYLVNMARGQVVDEEALMEALNCGRLAGAGLDVMNIEPLPKDSPLWDTKNVILTPHGTPPLRDREERALGYVLRNIEAYRRCERLENQLDEKDMYTK